jgi:hypothetical protein
MPTSKTPAHSRKTSNQQPQPSEPERVKLIPEMLTFGNVEHYFCSSISGFIALLWENSATRESLKQLNRYAYSKLGKRLIESKDGSERSDTFEEVRKLIASRLGKWPNEVDCLPFDEAVKVLCSDALAGQASAKALNLGED